MVEKRAGEYLRLTLEAFDEQNKVMSETTHEVYGLDNSASNQLYNDIIDSLQALLERYGVELKGNTPRGQPNK